MSRLHLRVRPKPGKPDHPRHILGWKGHAKVEVTRRRRAKKIAKPSRRRNRS